MKNFCEHCGKSLDGMECDCAGAVAARETRAAEAANITGATKNIASEIGKEATSSLKAVMKNPTEMAANHSFSMGLSLILLAIDAAAKIWFIERGIRSFLTAIFNSMRDGLGELDNFVRGFDLESLSDSAIRTMMGMLELFRTDHYFVLAAILAAQSAFFVVLICFLPKIIKNSELKITLDAALSTVAFAALPWTAASIISSLLLTLVSSNAMLAFIIVALFGAAMMVSASLLDIGMKKYLPDDKSRLSLTAIGYGIQMAAVIAALVTFIPSRIVEAFIELTQMR